MDQMAAAHRQDYADKDAMWALRMEIAEFLKHPPSRCSPLAVDALQEAVELLALNEARIVAVWD